MEIVTREKADAIALETLRSAGVDIKSTNDFETWLQAQSVEQMRKIIKNAHRDVWNWSYVKGDAAYWEDEERARDANGKIFVLRELIRRLRDECN